MRQRGKALSALLLVTALATVPAWAQDAALEEWGDQVRSRLGGTTITVGAQTHPSTEAFQAMEAEFEALTGIQVEWDVMEEIYLHDKLLTEHTARTGRYDVVSMDVTWIGEFAAKQVVDPLDAYLADPNKTPAWFDYEDIVPAYRDGLGSYDGKVYGIPSAGESAFVAYRQDLFDKYGYDPARIKTTDDLLEAARFFDEKEPGLSGISMRGRRGHHLVYGWFQFLYPYGGRVLKPGTTDVVVNSPEVVESLQFYLDLMKYAPTGIENFSHEEATTSFMQGQSALWFDATALAPWIEDAERSIVAGKVGYLPPPAGPDGAYGAVAGWNLALSAQSRNKDAAWAFIMFMTSRANAEEYVNRGGVVTRLSILDDPDFVERYPYYPQISASLDLANRLVEQGVDWRPRMPEWPRMGEILGLYGSQALVGQISAEQAAELAASEIQGLLRRR
ncbi:ABC transporter substrate-binding protein [Limnochorda pilosa]|uniref:ABC transporter substrate-binding protein n=1 Tax=Limnochorda pilosa TaxID=1555112 RepID=A0A0K2SLP3_LIMPI|nr:sugar ABC transporter substrate-binding protein [Limnochorda pilosa]BAS28046.1 ABC transporter substrate-binding protein [Limnochorda pilosa]